MHYSVRSAGDIQHLTSFGPRGGKGKEGSGHTQTSTARWQCGIAAAGRAGRVENKTEVVAHIFIERIEAQLGKARFMSGADSLSE
jgi:hypothetical protein